MAHPATAYPRCYAVVCRCVPPINLTMPDFHFCYTWLQVLAQHLRYHFQSSCFHTHTSCKRQTIDWRVPIDPVVSRRYFTHI